MLAFERSRSGCDPVVEVLEVELEGAAYFSELVELRHGSPVLLELKAAEERVESIPC